MFIEKLDIEIWNNKGEKWGRKISFLNEDNTPNEINLIYGENEVGKSTLIKSINYALGGEDIYGVAAKHITNLTAVLTEKVNNAPLKSSKITLQLLNHKNERTVIIRDALNRQAPVLVYRNQRIENITSETPVEFYKIKKDRNIEGNPTYNDFLMEYFQLPVYVTKDNVDKEKQVYFQNIMPLFFVPQKSWIDIQATNPFYGISDVKKIAFQLIFNLSEINSLNHKLLLQSKLAERREHEHTLKMVEDVVSIAEYKTIQEVDTQLGTLKNDLLILNSELKELQEKKNAENSTITPIEDEYHELKKEVETFDKEVKFLEKEVNQYSYYVDKINMDILKADKLKTARLLISNIPFTKCPHCYSNIDIDLESEIASHNCELCGNDIEATNSPDIDELINYLKDERKDFKSLLMKKEERKKEIHHILYYKNIRLKEIQNSIERVSTNLTPIFLVKYYNVSNKIGSTENRISSLNKERQVVQRYNDLQVSIHNLNIEIKNLKKEISKHEEAGNDNHKLKLFTGRFKYYLKEIDFLKYEKEETKGDEQYDETYFNRLFIDPNDYRPKIEDQNLYNLTSASGLIRIFNAYYLALLYTCLKLEFGDPSKKIKTNHPFLLILDEPRQQNLDISSYNKLIALYQQIATEFPNKFQIIFASGDTGKIDVKNIKLSLDDTNFSITHLNKKKD